MINMGNDAEITDVVGHSSVRKYNREFPLSKTLAVAVDVLSCPKVVPKLYFLCHSTFGHLNIITFRLITFQMR